MVAPNLNRLDIFDCKNLSFSASYLLHYALLQERSLTRSISSVTGGSTWTVPRPRGSTASMTRWQRRPQSVEEVEGVEALNDPRPDMELLGNDCNQQPFTFCDLLPCDGTAGDNSRCRLSTYL